MGEVLNLKNRGMGGAIRSHWFSAKRQRTMSLSDEAWDICTQFAANTEASRSEVLEVLLRDANRNHELDLRAVQQEIVEGEWAAFKENLAECKI